MFLLISIKFLFLIKNFIIFIRLFKENPNLEGDAIKVKNDRADLVVQLERLIDSIFKEELSKF